MSPGDAEIAATLLRLLAARRPESSICPSEVARALAPGDEAAWRALMPQVRAVAAALARQDRIRVTRGADALPPDDFGRGAIRLRRGPSFEP